MKCQRISTKGGLGYALHLLICRDCRNHRATDRAISDGLAGIRTTAHTQEGLDATLLAVERVERAGGAAMPFSHDILRRKTSLKRLRHKPQIALLVVVGLGVTGVSVFNYLEAVPTLNIPSPTLPNPNGFDVYVSASELHKNTRETQRKQVQLEQQEKARRDEARAIAILEKKTGKKIKPQSGGNGPAGGMMGQGNNTGDLVSDALMTAEQAKRLNAKTYTLAEQEKTLAPYKDSLAMLRGAFKLSYWNPPARSFTTLFPYLAEFRSMARTLSLEARVHEAKQEWGKAMEARLDILEMGSNVPKGGVLITDLVGIALGAIGTQNIGDVISHLSPEEAASALARLERISQTSFTFPQVMQEELWGTQGALMEIFNKSGWRWRREFVGMMSSSGTEPQMSNAEKTMRALPTLLTSRRAVMRNLTHYYEAQIQRTSAPYAKHLPEPAEPADLLSRILVPAVDPAYFRHTYSQVAIVDMLKIRLALRAYSAKTNAYPATLQELVSAHYLQAVPTDTFAEDGQFRYKRQGQSYLLYSVGPDGKDNGGKPIEIEQERRGKPEPQNRYLVNSTGKGDIVVGYNVK